MLTISTSQMYGLVREHAARDREAAWLRDELRASYGHLLKTVGDATILAELLEALAHCDALMLTSPGDRRIFCTWDQNCLPGHAHAGRNGRNG